MFSFVKKFSLVLFILLLSANSHAALVEGLYSTVLEVKSQQAGERESAFNDALLAVLLKASGDMQSLQRREIISRFFPAEQYVLSFSYTENPRYTEYLRYQPGLSTDGTGQAFEAPAPLPFLIEVNFSETALESAMRRIGLPIWGNVRPSIMLWIASEEAGQRQLIGLNNQAPLLTHLEQEAARFALPIAFPAADQTDLNALDISNLWGLFPDAVERAKSRYNTDGQLMLRVYKSMSNTWNANWYFTVSGESYRSSVTDVDIQKLSESVIAHAAGVLMERFSIKADQANTAGQVEIEVTNILNFQHYINVQNFLGKLAPVKAFSVNWVKGDTVSFSVALNSNTTQFFEYLNLSGKLTRLNDAIAVNQAPTQLPSESVNQLLLPEAARFKWQASASDLTPN